jgi:glycosyltransferase involved in cell wall biosynthesis
MEALASGLPALVSDIPGNREWLENSPAGWLFGDGDEVGLAEGIMKAYHQRQDLAKVGQAARHLAEERADWRKNFQVLLTAYQIAMAGAARKK